MFSIRRQNNAILLLKPVDENVILLEKVPIHICERTGNDLPGSVMLITRFTRVIHCIHMFNDQWRNQTKISVGGQN